MPRIRSIKPEFWQDEDIGALSVRARLLFIATWNLADDAGILRWTPEYVKASAFCYDAISVSTVRGVMNELVTAGKVRPYQGGKTSQQLAVIVNFPKHQRIDKPQVSKLPPPPDATNDSTNDSGNASPNPSAREAPNASANGSTPDLEQGAGSREQGSKTVAVRPHVRDEAWEGFVEVCGIEPADLSKQRRTRLNGMLRSLKDRTGMKQLSRDEQGAEIRRRAANHWTVPTPEYLVGHWAELDKPRPVKSSRVAPADRMLAEVREELESAAHRSESPVDDAPRSLPSA